MPKKRTSRRQFLQLAAGGAAVISTAGRAIAAAAAGGPAAIASIGDSRIVIENDARMHSRVWLVRTGHAKAPLTSWAPAEFLVGRDNARIADFAVREHHTDDVNGVLGRGSRLRLVGVADAHIEKTVEIELFERYPGFAIYRVSYRNLTGQPLKIRSWTNCALQLPAADPGGAEPRFWSYCGSTHSDRRDWVQPVRPGFTQQNFMGMTASDYGGGTPIVDVWRKDGGLAVGHLEQTQKLVALPVTRKGSSVDLSITAAADRTVPPGDAFSTHETFIATHTGDYFPVLDSYRRIMADRGFAAPAAPDAAYEAIWCAWGYERSCTVQLIEDTLPKVRDLGLRWAVIDDGWQSNVGDWNLNPQKYPRGQADMTQLVQSIRAHELKPRLWWAPLAVAPGSDVLHDHTDMLLLNKEGTPQNISWWNCFYLCPAYEKTVAYTTDLVTRFIRDWGFAGLKIDGQHLNGVAPCYNPAHKHARPEESVEKLQDLLLAVYQTATRLDPASVVELCPCGTAYSFFNLRSLNQAPGSDPESSWQVRHKGKTLKALIGPHAAYAGDHVELSTGGQDFASTVGIGGIVSTKFTWPQDPKPKDSFLLTPEREALWRKWIAIYNDRVLPRGTYRGELYDIGFDKPETHTIEKSGKFYYAFYASEYAGPVELRGLAAHRYRVRDYFNDRELGEVSGGSGRLQVSFKGHLMLEALPV